jgi:hypothetical protein
MWGHEGLLEDFPFLFGVLTPILGRCACGDVDAGGLTWFDGQETARVTTLAAAGFMLNYLSARAAKASREGKFLCIPNLEVFL